MDCRLLMTLLTLGLLPTVVVGLQCPSCTYVETVLSLFQNDKCTRPINGPTAGIDEEACAPPPGKIARCSFYNGSIDVKVALTTISYRTYSRGCYYFLPANLPSNGCHNRNNLNEDKSILQQIMAKVSSVVDDEIVSFKGDVCLCSDTYCQTSGKTSDQTSGQTSGSSSEFGSTCLVLSGFSVLFVWLMHKHQCQGLYI